MKRKNNQALKLTDKGSVVAFLKKPTIKNAEVITGILALNDF